MGARRQEPPPAGKVHNDSMRSRSSVAYDPGTPAFRVFESGGEMLRQLVDHVDSGLGSVSMCVTPAELEESGDRNSFQLPHRCGSDVLSSTSAPPTAAKADDLTIPGFVASNLRLRYEV
jgi:hypothetical protein